MHSIETMKKLEKQEAEQRAKTQSPEQVAAQAQAQKPVDQGQRA